MTILDESGTTIYDVLVARVKAAIEKLNPDGRTAVMRGDLRKEIESSYPREFELIQKSWAIYLPKAANDPDSGFQLVPGTYKYRLTPVEPDEPSAPQESAAAEEIEQEEEKARIEREKALYPLLVNWLSGRDLLARDTSSARGGGKWGNPDITGLRIVEGYLGQHHLEVTTIEAKVSTKNWEREFFEAVSHKRFAHRVYFAVAAPSETPGVGAFKLAPEMRRFGEKFGVGILVVFVRPADYETLTMSKALPLLDVDVVVLEVLPAVLESPDPELLTNYLHKTLHLETDADLYNFGRE